MQWCVCTGELSLIVSEEQYYYDVVVDQLSVWSVMFVCNDYSGMSSEDYFP